jgi:NADH-quinone oxidoreductase subunit L
METLFSIFPAHDFSLLAVILGLPALGAFVNGVFGKRLGKEAVRLLSLACVLGSFLASALAFVMLRAQAQGQFTFSLWHWFDLSVAGGLRSCPIDIKFTLDRLSSMMTLIVTGVGFLITLYATSYMWDDDREDGGYHRFFAYMSLFFFAMLVLVTAANLPVLFVGWEGVGLSSYLLIGFWYSEQANAAAGKKAFIANRIGDFGLLVAMALLLDSTGALDFQGIGAGYGALLERAQVWPIGHLPTSGVFGVFSKPALSWLSTPIQPTRATLIAFFLFLACVGKSAQIPLYVWLPDAMAGPTPVSALIHAATMVTAGVYLVCRLSAVFLLSPVAMATIAGTGAATALLAATIGLVQTDIKKVLAYSTVSQLGIMFMGVGVGAFSAGMFHLLTHAFFKAGLFLAAGSVIHAMHARIHDTAQAQDMRNMGGLRKWMPLTHFSFLSCALAIAGCPLTSGFFSKDEILGRVYRARVHAPSLGGEVRWEAWTWFGPALYVVGIVAATMTAFYVFRALFLTFWGDFRGWRVDRADPSGETPAVRAPHESPRSMTWPIVVLALLALEAGFFNAGVYFHFTPFDDWLAPLFRYTGSIATLREGGPSETLLAAVATGAFALGAGGAYVIYVMKKGEPARLLAEKAPRAYRLVLDKFRVDELYERTVIAALDALAEAAADFDKWVVDGILSRVTSAVVALTGTVLRAFQTGIVHAYAAVMMLGLFAMGWFFVWRPDASVSVQKKAPGLYALEAAPGLGYRFRWYSKSPDRPDTDAFGARRAVEVELPEGQTRSIKLEVKNAFERTAVKSIVLSGSAAQDRDRAGAP